MSKVKNQVKKALLPALFATTVLGVAGAFLSVNSVQAQAATTDGMQVTLTDGIVVKYYATLDADTTSATATFDSAENALDATVEGTKTESGVWEFIYNKITPQYVDQTFSISVNEQSRVTDCSVLKYCQDVIATTDATKKEKAVAQDLIYYGEAAKAYKVDGATVTAAPATTFAGTDGMTNTGTCTEENCIYGATVVFDSVPAIKFQFKKASSAATVTVDGTDVTAQLTQENGLYVYTQTGIYATDFDKQYTVELSNDGITQTVNYSVNDYAARMQTNDNVKMQTLAKALWCYGAGADALLNEQNKYIVVTEPTYTETGLARNGKGEEVTLPVLNAINYTYVQTAPDGSAYAYRNADGGKATFTHKDTGIVIEKTITPDTITFNWNDFNCVDIHFKGKPSGMTAVYEDGTYVLTLSKDVSIPNMYNLTSTLPNVKLVGEGATLTVPSDRFRGLNQFTLDGAKISASSTTAKGWTVESGELTLNNSLTNPLTVNGGTVTVNNGNVSTGYLYVAQGATLNITQSSGNDSFVIPAGGSVELNGTVNVTKPNSTKGTAFSLQSKTENDVTSYAKMKIGETAQITLGASYEYLFGCWSGPKIGYLFLPATAKKSGNNAVKVGENTVLSCTTITAGFNVFTTVTYGNYRTLTAPTLESEGKAVSFDKGEIALPKLNTTDYDVSVSGTTMSFTHKQYGAGASLSIADASNLQIGDLTVDYDSATSTYTYTVAEGKTVCLTKLSGNKLVIAGQGTLKVEGPSAANSGVVIATASLKVEAGATLIAYATNKQDALRLAAGAKAYFYGTVDVNGGGTSIWGDANTEIHLAKTSRVTTSGALFGGWNLTAENYIKLYVPAEATQKGNTIVYTNESGDEVTLLNAKNGMQCITVTTQA